MELVKFVDFFTITSKLHLSHSFGKYIPIEDIQREGIPKKHPFSRALSKLRGDHAKIEFDTFYFDHFLKVKKYPKLRAGWGRGNLGLSKRKGVFSWVPCLRLDIK